MLCESCGERSATVHLTRVVNGQKTERHLCETCAREEGDFEFMFELEPKFSINQLLSGLLEGSLAQRSPVRRRRDVNRCDYCGMTYEEFARTGKFGCDHCYETFEGQLESLFRRLHGHATHTGKVPSGEGTTSKLRRGLQDLRADLGEAINEERYEEAAKLRDKIRELEATLQAGQETEETES